MALKYHYIMILLYLCNINCESFNSIVCQRNDIFKSNNNQTNFLTVTCLCDINKLVDFNQENIKNLQVNNITVVELFTNSINTNNIKKLIFSTCNIGNIEAEAFKSMKLDLLLFNHSKLNNLEENSFGFEKQVAIIFDNCRINMNSSENFIIQADSIEMKNTIIPNSEQLPVFLDSNLILKNLKIENCLCFELCQNNLTNNSDNCTEMDLKNTTLYCKTENNTYETYENFCQKLRKQQTITNFEGFSVQSIIAMTVGVLWAASIIMIFVFSTIYRAIQDRNLTYKRKITYLVKPTPTNNK